MLSSVNWSGTTVLVRSGPVKITFPLVSSGIIGSSISFMPSLRVLRSCLNPDIVRSLPKLLLSSRGEILVGEVAIRPKSNKLPALRTSSALAVLLFLKF